MDYAESSLCHMYATFPNKFTQQIGQIIENGALQMVLCKWCNLCLKGITVQCMMGCVFVFVLSAIKLVLGVLWHESEYVPLNDTASRWIQ